MRLLLLLVLLPCFVGAQQLPPPGGWPLRPVAELRAVPEPPGGLVPYRQGPLWGFADTTGRVWIRPVFASEPLRFGSELLLWAERPAGFGPFKRRSGQQEPANEAATWNVRYGSFDASGILNPDAFPVRRAAFLLNACGEQLRASASEALAPTAGGWQAVRRPARFDLRRRELVAIASAEAGLNWPGRLQLAPLGPGPPALPRPLRGRYHKIDGELSRPFFANMPYYLVREINSQHPQELVWVHRGCYGRSQEKITRYRHEGRLALFDASGRRLTDYRYGGVKPLLPRRLAYWHENDSLFWDDHAADSSGVPQRRYFSEDINGPARRYGLLDRQGREIIPPLYARLEVVGPNSLWVVAVRGGRLHYGLLDTLGHYRLPLSPRPLSLPDAAGLLRRYSAAPRMGAESLYTFSPEPQYPDTATVQYLRADGQPAFAGRYAQAGPFWRGRALAKYQDQYGLLDTLGRWVLPPQPARLDYYALEYGQRGSQDKTDLLELFRPFSRERGMPYFGADPGDPLLLLTHDPAQGYGLRDGRTGQVVVPPVFNERPEQWHGGVVGRGGGQPLGYSYAGQSFNPEVPASYPPGVRRPALTDSEYLPLLLRTAQGWRTRSGRQFWQD
ncbi:MAG: WG repeat-containing protein [Janthinobacterium lividum]